MNGLLPVFSRNDRALLDQEIELLKKLDPNTDSAKKLREVINARITRWHTKAYSQRAGKQVRRSAFWGGFRFGLTAGNAFGLGFVAALILFLSYPSLLQR